MADDAVRSLLCIVEGDTELFKVKPTGSTDVLDLKDLIKEKGKNGMLGSVHAKDLVLWKVRMSMTSDNITNSPAG